MTIEPKTPIIPTALSLLSIILSREGLIGALLTIMIAAQVYDNYRGTSMQTELNTAIKNRMIEQTSHEKAEQAMLKELVRAIDAYKDE